MKITFTKKCLSFKRILLLLIVFGSTIYRANSQVVNTYSFSQTTGTFTPITTGTVLGVAANDDTSFPANPIGFSFTYGGNTYTTFSVNSNGFLALGSTVNSSYSVISTGGNNIVSALNADLQGLPTVGQMRFDTIGSAPNRTLVMQWKNYSMYSSTTNNLDSFDFQIRLNETSNTVEIKYGRFVKASGGNTVQVGVKGSSNTIYLNRTSTTSWTTSTAGTANSSTLSLTNTVLPTNGLTFTYTPPTPAAPTVFTGTKTNITTNTVTLAGSIAINQYPVITTSGIVVGTSANPTIGSFGVIDSTTNPIVTTGSFTKNIAGLSNATLYYYRAYAINSVGTTYGADSTFTTNATAVIPTVFRIAASNITALTATFGGNITSDGGSTVTASGIVYATTTNPLLFGTGVTDSTTNPLVTSGNYSFTTAGLNHSTKYYFKAYATNSVGTAYSNLDSFTTAPIVSVLPYFQNFDSVGTTGWGSIATGGLNEWVLGTPAKTQLSGSFSSPKCWFTSTAINYSNNHNAAVVSPQFDFTSYSVDPVVRFRHNFKTEANWDASVLEISINGGTWTKLDNTLGTGSNFNTTNSLSWYNSSSTNGPVTPSKWSNNSNLFSTNVSNWIQSQTVLTGAAGQSNVKFRIRFGSDGFGTNEGVAFDNVEVFPATAPIVVTGTKTNITTNTVTLAGSIAINQYPVITTSGIVVGTSANPTIGSFGVIDSTTNPVVTTGSFTKNIAGLSNATLYYYRAYAINSVGTTYGADSTFTTNATAVIPTVFRIAASNITALTATFGGNITSDGGSTVTASGIVYATTTNPLLFGTGVTDSTTNPLVATGTYSFTTAGLLHSTKYYFKAYATNSVGTAYSSLDSFTTAPIVSVLPYFQNFDSVGTTGWGSIATGGLNEWVLGTPAKTQLSGSFSSPKCWFTSTAINYSNNHNAAVVSPQFDFTSYSVDPVVRFRHNFKTEADWDASVLEISINGGTWTKLDNTLGTGTNFNTTNSLSWYNNSGTAGPVTPSKWSNNSNLFSTNVSNWIQSQTVLTGAAGQSNVKFRIRFGSDGFGTNEGVAFDNVEVFPATAPIVVTGTKTNVTNISADLTGTITSNGNSTITKSGIVYSTSSAPVLGAFGVIDSTTNPIVVIGSFTKGTTGLSISTLYHYRAYAINAVDTSYGADSTFTTNSTAVIPTVLRIAATNLTITTATFGGNITSDGGSTVTASGIVYSTTTNPLLFGTGVTDSTTNPLVTSGNYSFTTAGLNHSTKYYFKAYATNSVGTAYSSLDSFTTSPIVSVLPYFQNFDGVGNTGWTTASINARVNSWAVGTPNKIFINGAYSGANAFVTKLSGNYGSLGDEEAGLVSPQFDFTSSTSDPVLRFRNKHKTNLDPGFDCGVIEISINNGAWVRLNNQIGTGTNFNTLTSHAWCNLTNTSGFINSGNKFTNTTANYASQVNGWVESATRLTGAAGQSNVKIRFHFAADAFGTDEGWAIDDIEVVNIATPTTAASVVTISSVTNTTASVTCTVGNGQRRLVVARLNTFAAVAPFDSVLYVANPIFGAGNTTGNGNFVVYNGTGNTVVVTGLTMLTSYAFDVYEFNGKYMHNAFASAATNNITTLPVKLSYFEAKKANDDVKLVWITSSEINNKGFEVQRSVNGKTFETIAFVKGEGNSNSNVMYTSIDENAFAKNQVQKLYYRLNQIDFDGKSTLSPVKEISINDAVNDEIKVYPNPFTNELTIETLNTENTISTIQIIDVSSKVLYNQTDAVTKGLSTVKLSNTNNLAAGIYFVKVSSNGIVKTMKIVKQ